jgi:hypothetical protein
MHHFSHRLSLVIILVLLTVAVHAQNDMEYGYRPKMLVYENLKNDSVLRDFRRRFHLMERVVFHPVSYVMPQAPLFGFPCGDAYSDSLYHVKAGLDMLALERNTGLELTGQVYGRLDRKATSFLSTDDDDPVSVYKAKVQAEIGWDWINSKFYHRRYKERDIRLSADIARARQRLDDGRADMDAWADTLEQHWNHVIAGVMLCHVRNLDVLNEAYQMMLEQDRITSSQLLDVMNEKMQLEFQLAQFYAKDSVAPREALVWLKPEAIAIDTVSLRQQVAAANPQNQLNELKIAQLDNSAKLLGYTATMRLTPFARWSTYLTSQRKISNNVDFGVRFTFPLWNATKRQRESIAVQKDILRDENRGYTDNVMTHCRMNIDAVRRLNQAIAVEYRHLTQLKKYLAMRQQTYAKNQGRYSYIDRLLEYNQYLKSMERLYTQMKERSLSLIQIQRLANVPNVNSFVTTTPIP